MKDKGGEDNLVMFLSGMGGTGKSEVIKAFINSMSTYFDWNYDAYVVKITPHTGASACKIPDGKTIHSVADLRGTVGQAHMEAWKHGNQH